MSELFFKKKLDFFLKKHIDLLIDLLYHDKQLKSTRYSKAAGKCPFCTEVTFRFIEF